MFFRVNDSAYILRSIRRNLTLKLSSWRHWILLLLVVYHLCRKTAI